MKRIPGNIKKKALIYYRSHQAMIAIIRDNGFCVDCFWHGKSTEYAHVHHVKGRGTEAGDERENYKSLLCLCVPCHEALSSIRVYAKARAKFQLLLLEFANKHPINSSFEHNMYEQD